MQSESLFNALADPAAIVDWKGKFLEINDRVLELTGFKREKLVDSNFLRTKFLSSRNKAKAQVFGETVDWNSDAAL